MDYQGLARRVLFYLAIIFAAFSKCATAQKPRNINKPIIDSTMLHSGRWAMVTNGAISPHGGYVSYNVEGEQKGSVTLVLQDTARLWQRRLTGTGNCRFLRDDQHALIQIGDTLHILALGKNEADRLIAAQDYRYLPTSTEEYLIIYQKRSGKNEVIIGNLSTGSEQSLGTAISFEPDRDGKYVYLTTTNPADSTSQIIKAIDLSDLNTVQIWEGSSNETHGSMIFSKTSGQIAFLVTKKESQSSISTIWSYQAGGAAARPILSENDPRLTKGAKFSGYPDFSCNGHWLLFWLQMPKPISPIVPAAVGVKVDIWSYKDQYLLPDRLLKDQKASFDEASIDIDGKSFQMLTHQDMRLETQAESIKGDDVVISAGDTAQWQDLGGAFNFRRNYFLLDLATGHKRQFIKDAAKHISYFYFSPDSKWLIYFNGEKGHYYSYSVPKEITRDITQNIMARLSDAYLVAPEYLAITSPAGWWADERRVLIYDMYNLWGIDPSGQRPPINITGPAGAAKNIELRLFDERNGSNKKEIFSSGDTLMFTAFGEQTKYNGFTRVVLGTKAAPVDLKMAPCLYYLTGTQRPIGMDFSLGQQPVKAASANCWLVQRQTADEAPNYWLTADLKHFRPISDVKPQAPYRWLKAELIQFKQIDGTICQGILYKPEDFDAKRSYPMIINYYEQLSNRLFEFPLPGFTENDINIPWFVSRGYLVFTPDIHYKIASQSGKPPGWWAFNSIEAATKYVSGLPYVDHRHIGLQGHSFGGYETNYMVTHSRLFAAASEFSGPTDLISQYLSLTPGPEGLEDHEDVCTDLLETGQDRMGATLWQYPGPYIEGSPVLQANKVVTPLLMVHNKKDGIVTWRQGIEFYLALRRLRRAAWMLQYDDGNHSIYGRDAEDYTARLTQFFDFYLKNGPQPSWMADPRIK